MQPKSDEMIARHAEAVRLGLPTYSDPATGLAVFTARFLADRGYCCDSVCRHCPYGEAATAPGTSVGEG